MWRAMTKFFIRVNQAAFGTQYARWWCMQALGNDRSTALQVAYDALA